MKRTVAKLLEDREVEMWSIAPTATVFEALELLAEHNIGATVVIEEGNLVGIVSERDYARKVILAGMSSRETLVRDIMTPNPSTISIDQTVDDCMKIMTEGGFRHLPVLDDGELAGVVSIVDVVRAVMHNQASLIADLERYISG